jgi:hypothetical protein
MRYRRYGLELERLEPRHLEMVRGWRNREGVRLRMQYREVVSPEAQARWFTELDPTNDWYFVASRNRNSFGVFHVKQIRWHEKSGEAGGFVGGIESIGAAETGLAILALMDFAFVQLHLEWLEASYHPEYKQIEALNRGLGYEVFERHKNGFVRARVSRSRFLAATKAVRSAAERRYGPERRLLDADPWLMQHGRGCAPDY